MVGNDIHEINVHATTGLLTEIHTNFHKIAAINFSLIFTQSLQLPDVPMKVKSRNVMQSNLLFSDGHFKESLYVC